MPKHPPRALYFSVIVAAPLITFVIWLVRLRLGWSLPPFDHHGGIDNRGTLDDVFMLSIPLMMFGLPLFPLGLAAALGIPTAWWSTNYLPVMAATYLLYTALGLIGTWKPTRLLLWTLIVLLALNIAGCQMTSTVKGATDVCDAIFGH